MKQLESLTIDFGDPNNIIEFPNDRANIISIEVVDDVITLEFATPHGITGGDAGYVSIFRIFITGFYIENPTDEEVVFMGEMNSLFGLNAYYIDDTHLGIKYLTYSAFVYPTDLELDCYIGAFRFIIPMEITYISND
jgi:hypothetical protein